MSKNQICYHCEYWDWTDGEQGLCKRYPPKDNSTFLPAWPITHATNWCGEYKKNKEEKQETKNVKVK